MRTKHAKGKLCSCGAYPLRQEHRCVSSHEVKIPGVTSKPRRVFAGTHSEAAVMVADELEREGRFSIEAGGEAVVIVRRIGVRLWYAVTLTAVETTSYHPTDVRAIGSSRPSRQ